MLLVVETITWKPHIETAMEIALRWREAGEDVVFCNLRRGLPAVEDRMPSHRLIDLPETRIRRARPILERAGVRVLRPAYDASERSHARRVAREALAACEDFEDLKSLLYRDYPDIGWGVVSSVVSVARDAGANLATHRVLAKAYFESSVLVYDAVVRLISELSPDSVLLFNGRFATTRAVMRAAESAGVPWRIHERGGDKDRYWVADFLPHEMDRVQARMLADWHPDKGAEAHAWFQGRRQRIEREWHNFAASQEIGRLPAEMSGPEEWTTFFTSSEDEFVAIGDTYANVRFPDQVETIRLFAAAAQAAGLRPCVRVHPHMALKPRSERDRWNALRIPGLLVVAADDPADSYALMERSRVVCSYGSTVGIEATYWGRPSLLFGPSFYDRLGVCEQAGAREEIIRFLATPRLHPQDNALPYGAYYAGLGEPFRFYQADDLHSGRICGVALDDAPLVRAVRSAAGWVGAWKREGT
jgi:hypothetical protein